jgi:hypothetical protein
MVNVLETGVGGVVIRLGYIQLRHRVLYIMFFFGFGLRSSGQATEKEKD